jgi:hypothetical protein
VTTLAEGRRSNTDHKAPGRLRGGERRNDCSRFRVFQARPAPGRDQILLPKVTEAEVVNAAIEECEHPCKILRATALLARFDSASKVEWAAIDGAA